jgi:hypothetical protein
MTDVDLEFRELRSTDDRLCDVARIHYRAWQDCDASIIAGRPHENGLGLVDGYKKSIEQNSHSFLAAENVPYLTFAQHHEAEPSDAQLLELPDVLSDRARHIATTLRCLGSAKATQAGDGD